MTQARNAAKALLREYGLAGASGSLTTESAWKQRLLQVMPTEIKTLIEAHFSTFQLASGQMAALTKQAEELGRCNWVFEVMETVAGIGPLTRLALSAFL